MDHPAETLLVEIGSYLNRTGMSPTIFGLNAINDPNLVKNLRAGREPRIRTIQRVRDFMAANVETAT